MDRRLCWALWCLLPGCGAGSESSSLPADAEAMRSYLKSGVTLVMPRLGGAGGVFPLALNPGAPGASDIEFEPDPTPAAPPNSYVFTLHLDGDGNGSNETTFTGSATFNRDPATAADDGFGGHAHLTMQTAGGLGTITGDMEFLLTATGGEISGTGTFEEVVTGNATTLTVPSTAPLHIQMAKGTANSVANACASSLDGALQLDVEGPSGAMTSTWGFQNTRSTARVTGASFTDNDDKTTEIPDADVTIPCGQGTSRSDWVGVFTQDWSCIPGEFGSATLTLGLSGNDKISITDEDPPSSGDIDTYQATVISGNPHVLRGFFIGGPPGATYREDFSWILNEDGDGFSQVSSYVYQEGPNTGSGGLCGGRAVRGP